MGPAQRGSCIMKYSNNQCEIIMARKIVLKQHACSLLCSEETRKEFDISGCVLLGPSSHIVHLYKSFPTPIIIIIIMDKKNYCERGTSTCIILLYYLKR